MRSLCGEPNYYNRVWVFHRVLALAGAKYRKGSLNLRKGVGTKKSKGWRGMGQLEKDEDFLSCGPREEVFDDVKFNYQSVLNFID